MWAAALDVGGCGCADRVELQLLLGLRLQLLDLVLKLLHCQVAARGQRKLLHALSQRCLTHVHNVHDIPLALLNACP